MSSAPPTRTATVIIPTFDHGPMIAHAIRSVLEQTIADLEVLVVGDGAPTETERTVATISDDDPRVHWFGFDKGPRFGENHRHEVLIRHAQGRTVFYLGDDDLWLPDHLARLIPVLDDHECVFGLDVRVLPDGGVGGRVHDLALAAYRDRLLHGDNRTSLSAFGHRLDTYLDLPQGWHTTPDGINTDTYLYQQFLANGATAASMLVPTVLHLGSPPRRHMTNTEREQEIARYAESLGDPAWRRKAIDAPASIYIQHQAAMFEIAGWDLDTELTALRSSHRLEIEQLEKHLDSGRTALRTILRKGLRRLRPHRRRFRLDRSVHGR